MNTDFAFQIADLPAEGRLRRVQPPLGRERQASLLGDGNEIAKMPQLHSSFHAFEGMPLNLTKSFSGPPGKPKSPHDGTHRRNPGVG